MDFDSDTDKSFPKREYGTLQPVQLTPEAASILKADDTDLEALVEVAKSLEDMAAPPSTPEVHEHVSRLGQRAEEKQREQQAGPGC